MSEDLRTIRDFFRYAVTEFGKAELVFGQGATNAIDEAAFIVLEALRLPIDDINPWLDARLTAPERNRVAGLIGERISTRKPAPYLLNRAYLRGVGFYVDERVIVPRSYIAELLERIPELPDAPEEISSVLDLCTGSGSLAILAALTYPAARVTGADVSADALAVAQRNIEEHGLEDRVALRKGDLLAPLRGERFDLILTNPPYVDAEAMSELPPEYRAEPSLALAAGEDGLDIVRRILAEASKHLTANGGLLCEVGRGRERLGAAYPDVPFFWMDTEESDGEVFWLSAQNLRSI